MIIDEIRVKLFLFSFGMNLSLWKFYLLSSTSNILLLLFKLYNALDETRAIKEVSYLWTVWTLLRKNNCLCSLIEHKQVLLLNKSSSNIKTQRFYFFCRQKYIFGPHILGVFSFRSLCFITFHFVLDFFIQLHLNLFTLFFLIFLETSHQI